MANRRTILDYPRNEAGLVDEFIGTAYDAMYALYENLDALVNMSLNIDQVLKAAEDAKLSAIEAAKQADRAQKIVDDFLANGDFGNLNAIGIYTATAFGLIGGAGPAVHGWDSGDANDKGTIGAMVMSNEQNYPNAKGSAQSLLMPTGEFKGPIQILKENMDKISRGVRPGFYIYGIPGQAISGEIIIRQMNLKRSTLV